MTTHALVVSEAAGGGSPRGLAMALVFGLFAAACFIVPAVAAVRFSRTALTRNGRYAGQRAPLADRLALLTQLPVMVLTILGWLSTWAALSQLFRTGSVARWVSAIEFVGLVALVSAFAGVAITRVRLRRVEHTRGNELARALELPLTRHRWTPTQAGGLAVLAASLFTVVAMPAEFVLVTYWKGQQWMDHPRSADPDALTNGDIVVCTLVISYALAAGLFVWLMVITQRRRTRNAQHPGQLVGQS